MTESIEGIVTAIPDEIKDLKSGTNKKGNPWTLWGTKLEVEYQEYGITAFSKKEVETRLGAVTLGDRVKIQVVKERGFVNLVEKTQVVTVSQGNSLPSRQSPAQGPLEPQPKVQRGIIEFPDEKIKNEIQQDMEWAFSATGQVMAFRDGGAKENSREIKPFSNEEEQDIAVSLFIEIRKTRRGAKW